MRTKTTIRIKIIIIINQNKYNKTRWRRKEESYEKYTITLMKQKTNIIKCNKINENNKEDNKEKYNNINNNNEEDREDNQENNLSSSLPYSGGFQAEEGQ